MSRVDQLRDDLGGPHPLAVNKVKDHPLSLFFLAQTFLKF